MRPCGHATNEPDCPACRWCVSPTPTGAAYRRLWEEPEPLRKDRLHVRLTIPCVHLGGDTGETAHCPTCPSGGPGHRVPLLTCAVYGRTTGRRAAPGVRSCWKCDDYKEWPGAEILPIDSGRMLPGRNFNCSLAVHHGRRILAYRQEWSKSRIRFAELGDDWQPFRNVAPHWPAPPRAWGHEDPRLFLFRDQLHCSVTYYDGRKTDVGYVRLNDDLHPEEGWQLDVPNRLPWEKSWMMFQWQDDLYAVYTVTPHVVLRIDGGKAERLYHTDWSPQWAHGEMRGGCPPVRVGDEYYHFFHSKTPDGTYSLGVMAFEARPPFRAVRHCPTPLVTADPAERPDPGMLSVIYPGSALLHEGRWCVAAGFMDSGCRLYWFDAATVEKGLRPC